MNPEAFHKQYLLNGSSNDMAVNGAVTPVVFQKEISAGYKMKIQRVMIYLEGSGDFSSEKFGNLTALTNGVEISAGGIVLETWKDNIDLTTCMFDTEGRTNFGKAARSISGRWTLSKEIGTELTLHAGDTFSMKVQDNLSTLVFFRAKLGGALLESLT